jgi:hypothetical protein
MPTEIRVQQMTGGLDQFVLLHSRLAIVRTVS